MINMSEYIESKFPDNNVNSSGRIHAHCPFHDDRRPSFSIDTNEGVFICGSAQCGVRGTFPLFYKLMENLSSWKDVYSQLKQTSTDFSLDDLFGSSKSSPKEQKVNPFPTEDCLEEIGHLQYLEDRGIGQDVIDTYGLKYGNLGKFSGQYISQSIVCPVWDIDGTYRTFQLRYLTSISGKRWANASDGPIQNLLYGGWAVCTEKKYLWIVEGASDVWNLASHGAQAVALNTKEASAAQMNRILALSRLHNVTPVVCMDGDAQEATEKIFHEIRAMGVEPKLVLLEDKQDPGGLTSTQYQDLYKGLNVI